MSKIVVPGEMISEKPERQAYTYVENNKTYSSVTGLLGEDGRLVPLAGPYDPMVEDFIVGIVTDVKFAGYVTEINSPYTGFISARESHDKFELGDIVYCRIMTADEVKNIDLTEARKLRDGRIIKFSAVKIPRLIGKRNSMINMIRSATETDIVIGRNGYVWLSDHGNSALAIETMNKIDHEAHVSGLTDRIHLFLEEKTGKKLEIEQNDATAQAQYPASQGGSAAPQGDYPPRRTGGFRENSRPQSGGGRFGGSSGGSSERPRRFGGSREGAVKKEGEF